MRKIYLLLGATFLLSLFGGNSLLAQCNIQVSVSSVGWGDVTSWELQDGGGTAVLSGGTYGNGYSDVQSTVGTNPPYTLVFTINNASFCDNSPNYVVTLDGVTDISGNISVGCANVVIPLAVSPCPPATPPTPTQDPGIPTCLAGTNLSVVGTPDTDVLWYWQTSASGTSMSDLYTGPYNVFTNGTYYLRAYHTVNLDWSTNSSSVVVSNFPTATAPPAPTADLNPACVTTGSTLTVNPAPAGFEYYWQGTTVDGTSNSLPANVTYNATASGTYHVAAFETATGCWSPTSFINVTVDTYIPDAPSAAISDYFICAGITSQEITATAPANGSVSATTGPISLPIPDSNPAGVSSPIVISGIPAGATITGIDVNFNLTHTWNSDMDFSLIGPNLAVVDLSSDNGGSGDNYTNTTISSAGVTPITSAVAPMTGVYAPEGSMAPLYTVPNGTWTLFMADDAGGDLGTLLNWTITISYSLPVSTLDWYDAATAGTFINSGTPLETIGTSVISSPAPGGVFSFFAESVSGGCTSATRTEITVSSSPVNVQLIPVAVTCNNGNDGTFTLGVVTCGSSPFTYSTDGGVTFGAIPTDLTVGDHSIIVKDALDLLSGTYTVTIGDAPAPSALVVNDFTNDIVDFSWTGNGTEAAWHVEWGLAGFTPGTGNEVGSANVSLPTHIATGLDGYTEYDFYVAADCGAGTSAGTWVSISQLTLCDPLVAQGFCETFDSNSPTEACWTVKNENGDVDFWNMNYNVNMYSGDQVAMMFTDGNGGVNNDWLISPMMTLTNNEILSFFYRVQSAGEPNDFELLLSTTGMDPADFTNVLMSSAVYSNTVYTDTIIDLAAYSGDCYIAVHVPNGGLDGWRLYIDQFCIDICTPDAGTDGANDACRLDNTLDLNTVITQGEPNGVWEFNANPGILSGSDLNLDLLPDGTYDFEYIVTTACTMDTTIATVTVHPASSAGNDGTIDDNCTNWSSINLTDGLSGSIDLGGSWTNVSGEGDLDGSLWTPSETTLAGSYDFEYVVSNGFCPNDTSVVTVTLISCLGVDGNETVRISVYPNPVTDVLTIQNLSIETGIIEVLDVQGKVVSAVQVNGVYGNYALDMNNLQRGMYIVRITTETSVQEVRVVKH